MKDATQFWANVAKGGDNDCWPWERARTSEGKELTYGVVYIGKIRWRTHKLAYTLTKGETPEGMLVCHTCDNPPCCNPNHLFLGTIQDNSNDMIAKGRSPRSRGKSNGANVLTERQVKDIVAEYIPGKVGYKRLGKKYDIHPQTVNDILKGKIWGWLTGIVSA